MLNLLCGLVLCLPASGAKPAKMELAQPTLVISAKSIEGLLDDLRMAIKLVGKPGDLENMEARLKAGLPDGFEGIDAGKPILAYGILEENLQDSSVVVMIPVKSLDGFFGMIERVTKLKPTKEENGIYSYKVDSLPVPIHVKLAHGYACVAPGILARSLEKVMDPTTLLGNAKPQSLAAIFRIQQIPDVYKQIGIGQLELRITDLGEKKPGQSAAEHALAEQFAREAARRVTMLIRDGREIKLAFDLNRDKKEITADLAVTGTDGSPLAADIASLGGAKSLFAGFLDGASAAKLVLHATLPGAIQKVLGPAIDEAFKKQLAAEKDEQKRALAQPLVDAIAPTLKSGDLDFGLALPGPGAGKHYGAVIGLKVKSGLGIEKAVKDLREKIPDLQGVLKVDVESMGAVKVHQLDLPMDDNGKKLLGDNPFYIAFKDNALLISAGENGLPLLKQAIAGQPAAAGLLTGKLSMEKLAPLMQNTKADASKAATQVFASADKGRDGVHLQVEGGKELSIHLSLQAPVLKFLQAINPQ